MKIKVNFKGFMLLALFTVLSNFAFAQRTVTGVVKDADNGESLVGASVVVTGTTKGTLTDLDGKYELQVPAEAVSLTFSYTGYSNLTIALGASKVVDANLTGGSILEAVQVIGYGAIRKRDVTGAVASLGAKDFNQGVINSPEQLLQGRVAGVQMTPNSGDPGAGIAVSIRGTASLRGNNDPLYVIDGVPVDNSDVSANTSGNGGATGMGSVAGRNPLNFLNPADIENISVLKDASAAAIYGARGANGVVLITTKKGKAGAGVFSLTVSGSVSQAASKYDLLSSAEFIEQMKAAGLNTSDKLINGGASTDWQQEAFRSAFTKNFGLNYGGGTDKTSYYFSLGYQGQDGIIKNTSQNRLQARINATHKLLDDKVTVGVALTTARIDDTYGATGGNVGFDGNLLSRVLNTNPTFPVTDAATGKLYTTGNPSFRNPVALLNNFHLYGPTNRTFANVFATWNITNALSYKLNLAQDNSTSKLNNYLDPQTPGFANSVPNNAGRAVIDNRSKKTSTIEHTLNFKQDFGSHGIDAVAGFSYQKFENAGDFVQADYFTVASGTNLVNNIGFTDNTGLNKAYVGGSFANLTELQSYFGRVAYNYAGKYYLTGTLRVDGSSKFGTNNKYGQFPAVNAAWRITGEDFLKNSTLIDDLKLRVGYGITGNSEGFPANQSITTYVPDAGSGGIKKENIANNDLKWESMTSIGVGVDFSLLKGKLFGTIDYFKKTTNDLLFPLSAQQPDVATTKWSNLDATVENSGVEFTLNYNVLTSDKGFNWTTGINATSLKNELTKLNNTVITGTIFGQGLSGAYVQPLKAGYPLYSFHVPEFQGFDAKGESKTSADRVYAGSPIPTFTWGWNNSFTFGAWNASVFVNGQNGGYVFNNTALALGGKPGLKQGNNTDKRWINASESYSNGLSGTTRFVEKSDFIRLSNLSIGRNIALNNKYIKSVNVSFAGQNLFLITDYKGLDPEVTNPNSAINGVTSRGIDYVSYPKARTFTLSLNANF
jgi:TonB-dependent starch-binding outer membrane protein SusC